MDCCCSFDQLKHFSSTSHCKLLTCLFFSFLQIPVQAKMLVALVSSSSRLFLLQNNNNKGHAKFSHGLSTCEHFPLFCGVLIQENFLSFTSLFSPFLPWILFCFHLPCSGNKADFYLYAQMLGRCNLVGFLYSSPSSLFLSLSSSPAVLSLSV